MVRGTMVLLLLAGCSSQSSGPTDLGVPDSSPPPCTLVFSGDESGTLFCYQRFCRSTTSDSLQFYGGPIGSFQAVFGVDGGFTPGRTYTAADLGMFLVDARFRFTTYYVGSTVALTLTSIEPNDNVGCASGNATAHGTAHVSLIEQLDGDGGTRPPNHVTLDASF